MIGHKKVTWTKKTSITNYLKLVGITVFHLFQPSYYFLVGDRIGFANTSPLELVIATKNHNINVLDQGKATQLS